MPYNVLISKIRCDNPNKKNAAIHNKNHFIYIGTREGTDLTPVELENTDKFEKEMASSHDYVRYIAKRPHSHGLFGNIPLDDINEFSKSIYKLSKQKRNIYRGIVSLDPRDAEALGYYDKAKWESYIRSIIPDVAKEFGISVDKLQWTAAYHSEAKHPHVHYMFWSSKPMIQDPFISEARQNKCRQLLSGKMFREEHENEVINKEISEKFIKEFGEKLSSEEIYRISTMTAGLRNSTILPQKIPMKQLEKTTEELLTLLSMLPNHGHLYYKYMPPDVKVQINKIVDIILNNKSVNDAYKKYLGAIDKISMTYSPSIKERENAKWKDNAIKKLRKDLCNTILDDIRDQIKIHSDFISFATDLLDQYDNWYTDDKQSVNVFNKSTYKLPLKEHLSNSPLSEDNTSTLLPRSQSYSNSTSEEINRNSIKTIRSLHEGKPKDDMNNYSLGKLYSKQDSPLYEMERAISYFNQAAYNNDSYAQLQLSIIYLWGKGIKRDVALGKYYLNQSMMNKNLFSQQILDSYETYRMQYVMNISYKLFANFFKAISNINDRAATASVEKYFRNLSKKAIIEEQVKNPHKHSQ